MKGRTLAQVLLARVLLSISLLAAAVLRQNAISLVYFLLLLVAPLINRRKHFFDGAFRAHILVVMLYSILVVLAQLAFQLYLILYAVIYDEHYGYVLHPNGTSCDLVDTLQWIGFERVDAPPEEVYHSVRLLLPDVVMLLVSTITYGVLTALYKVVGETDSTAATRSSSKTGVVKKYVETFGEFTIFMLLGASAAMVPSVTSAFYFLIFFGILIYYSLHLPFNMKSYGVLKLVLFAYVACHMVLLYLCQFNFLQTWLDDPSHVYYARLFGMTPLFITECERPWVIEMDDHTWPYFVNPCVLFALFIVLSMDYGYRSSKEAMPLADLTESAESSPISRADSTRSSERQLLAHAEEPAGYGSVSTDAPDAADAEPADVEPAEEQPVRKTWNTIYNTLLHNSYLMAFFAMVGWAVAYPSWTAFVFLILGCVLWLFPDARKATLISSPVVVMYAVCLCVLQYVCSLNFGGIDYNSTLFFNATDEYSLSTIGLIGYDYPATVIMVKMLLTMLFCVVLRQLRRDNCFRSNDTVERGLHLSSLSASGDVEAEAEAAEVQSVDDSNIVIIGRTVYTWISKYWLIAFYILLLIMAIQEPYIYRLVYMVLFLCSAITFQLYYPLWRYTLLVFLIVVAIYSILAIQLVYVFSFYDILHAFQNATNLSSEWLTDLGFDPDINYQDGAANQLLLLSRLIVPALLLVAVMLEIHIFHGTFMSLTDTANIDRYMSAEAEPPQVDTSDKQDGGFVADLVNLMKRLRPHGHKIFYATCRLFTIHLYKGVYIYAVYLLTREASAFSFILLVILNLSLFFDPVGKCRKVCVLIAQFWIGIIILARMLFQLNSIPKDLLQANCTSKNATFYNGSVIPSDDPDLLDGPQDASAWLGLKTLTTDSLPYYIGGYVMVLVGLTILAMFRVHDYYRSKVVPTLPGITFPSITHECLDSSFLNSIGYLINFGFIKFGLEISLICTTIVLCYRQDVVGAIYVLLLAMLLVLNMYGRRHVRRVWFIYMVILALLLPIQYLSALGLPTTLCRTYPWIGSLDESLRIWLYMPSYSTPPYISVLFADCIQLMFVTLQFHVFQLESEEGNLIIAAAGTNEEFGSKPPACFKDMHDFIETKRNMVDVILSTMCGYWFWVCISMLFVTGTQNINLYCFGYLISSFYFFWHGLDFTIKPKKAIMRTWNGVLFYNMFVLLLKTCLQIVGCAFLEDLLHSTKNLSAQNSQCYIPELLSIKCLNSELETSEEVCGVSQAEAGLMWDVLCFAVLLLQRRIFMSTYFLIVVLEEKSQAALSSRGAELINGLSAKRIAKQQENYTKEMVSIRKKLDKIRMRTSRLEGGASREDWTHFDVIRSGDASMFEEGSDDETTITDLDVEETGEPDKANPIKMLVTAMDSGVESSLKQRKLEKSKQRSMDRGKSFDDDSGPASDHGDDEAKKLADSQEGAGEGSGDADEKATAKTIGEKAQTTDAWFKQFVIACIKWIINKLNEISADYRTVASQIDREQVVEKEKERERMLASIDDNTPPATGVEQSAVSTCEIQIEELEDRWQEAFEQRSLFYRFFNALYLACIARTEFICYFTIILCNICYGTLLSLPLPLVALIWGMLSIPRPAKTFWIIILTYVMSVVMIKYMFQFSFWPWTSNSISSWSDPRLLFGLEDTEVLQCTTNMEEDDCSDVGDSYYATYELLILLSIFIHRSVLKRYGLWRNETEQSEDLERMRQASVSEQPRVSAEIEGSLPDAEEHEDISSQAFASTSGEKTEKKKSKSSIANWYRNITSGKMFMTGDYYAPMVFCDFTNFIISVFFFSSFGSTAGGNVQEYIETNLIPVGFLVLLLLQFASIVIDRALYLQKSVIGKLIYTILLIIVIHVYTMFILPSLNGLPFNLNTVVQIWYFIKCIYFGLSAWQIKSGYPTGVLGNFLTTKYSYVNLVLFEAFIICPFLLELRCAMDWMWTKSAMSLSTWFVMEDIFAKIFIIKCFRQGEITFPAKRATNKKRLMKYGFGGFVLISLILVIWFPLLLFSFATTIYNPNPPIKCQMTVSIEGFQDLFTVKSQVDGISSVTTDEFSEFKDLLSKSSSATGFLNVYEAKDVTTILLKGESTAIWGITPPSEDDLAAQLLGNDSLSVTVTLDFTRQPQEGLTAGTISTQYFYNLSSPITRYALHNQIVHNGGTPVNVSEFLPRYIVLPASGEPRVATSLHCTPFCTDNDLDDNKLPYHGLSLNLTKSKVMEYWSVTERSNYTQDLVFSSTPTKHRYNQMFFVTFSERIAPSAVSMLTGPGIIGLYVGLVFVVGQFIRTLTSGGSYIIMFNDLPNVDKIMKLCKDLYFVRENGELDLEEELYAKLVFLYRSPPTMIEWTKKET